MLKCNRCGNPAKEIAVTRDGSQVAHGFLCDPCLDVALAGAAEWRRQFDELRASGVGRRDANRAIIERMNGAVAS